MTLRILALVIGLWLLPHAAGLAQETQPGEIQLTLKRIERQTAEVVLVQVRISNWKTESIFIPNHGPEKTASLRTWAIEQLQADGTWKAVASSCQDVPPVDVYELKAGQSVEVPFVLAEQIPRMCGGGKNDFRGKHRAVLYYHDSLAPWKDYQTYLRTGDIKKLPGKMPKATSHTFEIPPFREPTR